MLEKAFSLDGGAYSCVNAVQDSTVRCSLVNLNQRDNAQVSRERGSPIRTSTTFW